jgi:predicted small secreted protein
MKRKMIALALALATAASVAACQTPQQQNAVVGGAL